MSLNRMRNQSWAEQVEPTKGYVHSIKGPRILFQILAGSWGNHFKMADYPWKEWKEKSMKVWVLRSQQIFLSSSIIFFATLQVHILIISQANQKDSPVRQSFPISIHILDRSSFSPLVCRLVICLFCSIKESKSLEMVRNGVLPSFPCPK